MKFRGILALALMLVCAPALAQVQPGASPLSGRKGGTNNAFMQFSGPASSMKTFTVPNANSTLAALGAIQTWTAAQSFSDGTLILLGSSSGSSTIKAPATGGGVATLFPGTDTIAGLAAAQTLTNKTINGAALSGTFTGTPAFSGANFLTLANLPQSTAGAQFLGVSGSSAANYAPFTLASLSNLASPSATLDLIPIVDHNTGTIKNVTPSALGAAGAVSSVNGQIGALVLWTPPQGRLTLTSGTPVMATSVAAATTVYYTGYAGKNVPIYNGSAVAQYQICAANTAGACEQSVALGSSWQANTNYDFFEGLNSGVPTLCTGPLWSSDTSRGTGAGTAELQQLDGLNTNKVSMTCRFNNTSGTFTCPVNQCTYLGTMRTGALGQTNFIYGASAAGGTAGVFGLWNAYNRISIRTTVNDSNVNWNYPTATIRSADNSSANRVSFLSGLAEDGFSCQYTNRIQIAASGFFTIGCALDSTSAFDRKNLALNGAGAVSHFPIAVKNDYNPTLGWHFVQALEAGDGTNNNPSAGGTDSSFIFEFQM